MTAPKISRQALNAALRGLTRLGIKAARYSLNGYTGAELRELSADALEIVAALLAAADDADGEG